MKKVFGILGLSITLGFGVLFLGQNQVICANATDEPTTSEVVPTEETQQENSISEEITQTCKDCIVFIKEFLSQPLVIGGVSTTIGALAILIVSKAIGGISKKKLKETNDKVSLLLSEMGDCIKTKDFEKMEQKCNMLVELSKEQVATIKNIKVKENCEKLLVELEPVKEKAVEFAKKETKVVVEDTKPVAKEITNDIADILKKY